MPRFFADGLGQLPAVHEDFLIRVELVRLGCNMRLIYEHNIPLKFNELIFNGRTFYIIYGGYEERIILPEKEDSVLYPVLTKLTTICLLMN